MTIIGSSSADITALKAEMADKANSSQIGYALVSAGTVETNNRYTFDNPFGNSVPVITLCELYLNGVWGTTGIGKSTSSNTSFLTQGGYVEGVGLVVQTGTGGVAGGSADGGGTTGFTASAQSAACRIHVWKVSN